MADRSAAALALRPDVDARLQILFVDDEPKVLTAIERQLRKKLWRRTGHHALRQRRPDPRSG
jgi:hypothetical protein